MPPLPKQFGTDCCRGGIYPALILSPLRRARLLVPALWCGRLARTFTATDPVQARRLPHKGARFRDPASFFELRRDYSVRPVGPNQIKNRAWRPGENRDKKLVVGSRSFQRRLNYGRRRTSRLRMTRGPVRRRNARNPIVSGRANQPLPAAARCASI